PRSTLFPYTTLFRSTAAKPRCQLPATPNPAPATYADVVQTPRVYGAAATASRQSPAAHSPPAPLPCHSAPPGCPAPTAATQPWRSEEHTSELQSREN